jgi:hypothetical protein
MAAPPLFVGAVHDRLICVGETADAERLVGAPGALTADEDVGCTTASVDALWLVPNDVIAYTR